jgi:hypothetical protein
MNQDPESIDRYEDELRRKATPSGYGAVAYIVVSLVFTIAVSALTWLFWDSLLGRR